MKIGKNPSVPPAPKKEVVRGLLTTHSLRLLEQEEEAGVDARVNPVNICGLTAIVGGKIQFKYRDFGIQIGLKTITDHSHSPEIVRERFSGVQVLRSLLPSSLTGFVGPSLSKLELAQSRQ